jgi:amino acid permease
MQMFPVFEIMEKSDTFKKWKGLGRQRYDWAKSFLARTLLVLFTFIVAVSVPKFGLFVNLLGALSGTALAFVMPILIYNELHKDEITRGRSVMHILLLTFGCIVGTIASAISLYELIKAFGGEEVHPLQQPVPPEITKTI